MPRINSFFLLLWIIILGHPLMAQNDSLPSDRKIKVVCDRNEPLPFLPLSLLVSGDILHTTTDAKGELTLPKTVDAITFRVEQEFGFILSDSIWNPNQTEIVISSQISRINPVSITTTVQPILSTDNPYSIQVINSKTIAQMGAQNVSDVLQNQSGVLIGQDPSLGASVQLQGLGGQNVKILINGVPMIGRLNGNIDVSQIPTEQIERIEIVEGPMSVVYGTDAIGGVINIITKTPKTTERNLRIKSYADAVGNFNSDFGLTTFKSLNAAKGRYLGFDLNAGRQFFQGFDFDPSSRSMDWKPKTRIYGDAQLRYKQRNVEQTLRYSHYYEYLLDRSNAEYNLINISGYNNYFHTQRKDISAITDIKINRKHALRFQNAFNIYEREKINVRRNLVTGSEVITRPDDQDTTWNGAMNLRGLWEYRPLSGHISTLLGYEVQSESLITQRVKSGTQIHDIALFGSLEYTPNKSINIKPSLRLSYNSAFGNAIFPEYFDSRLKIAPLIPSLQIKANISEHLVLRSSYARGFRAPTAKELYFLFVDINHNVQGNINLKAENSHNFNLSLDYRHAIDRYTGVTFKLSSFYTRVSDQIQLSLVDINTNLYQYINIGALHSEGITAQTQLFVGAWDVNLSYSLIGNSSRFDAESNIRRWIIPQGTVNLSYAWKKTGSTLNLFSRYTGKMQGFVNDGSTYEMASYWLADINLTQNLIKNRLQFQVGAKNIFGVSQIQNMAPSGGIHGSSGGINIAMGRNYFVQCTLIL